MTYYVNPPNGLPTFTTYNILGKCSKCGGDVKVPSVWMSVVPPVPTCSSCGATKKDSRPTIEME
jgi:hypothetical protein